MKKIVIIYPAPKHYFYYKKKFFNKYDFSLFKSKLEEENFILPGSLGAKIAKEGFEVTNIIFPDIDFLRALAIESKFSGSIFKNSDPYKFLIEYLSLLSPDILHIYAGANHCITRKYRNQIRRNINHLIITAQWGDELNPKLYNYKEYLGDLDYVFTSSNFYSDKFNEISVPNKVIGNCFDDSIKFDKNRNKKFDAIFCGTTGYLSFEHIDRFHILRYLLLNQSVTIFGDDSNIYRERNLLTVFLYLLYKIPLFILDFFYIFLKISSYILRKNFFRKFEDIVGLIIVFKNQKLPYIYLYYSMFPHPDPDATYFFDKLPLAKEFSKSFNDQKILGSDYYSLLSQSKIIINIHRSEIGDVGNIRVYEALGVNSLLITDHYKELKEHGLIEGKDFIGFTDELDLKDKIDFYLSNDDLREKIALSGHKKVMKFHTASNRAKQMSETFYDLLDKKNTLKKKLNLNTSLDLLAVYDTNCQPISYDFSFFVQAAEVYRKINKLDNLFVCVLEPVDIENQPGVSEKDKLIMTGDSLKFRIDNIFSGIMKLYPHATYMRFASRSHFNKFRTSNDFNTFPENIDAIPHHSEYYKLVNKNANLITSFAASEKSKSIMNNWLRKNNLQNKKLITLTLRQYLHNPERNNNISEWNKFLNHISDDYSIVIIPDTEYELNDIDEKIDDFIYCDMAAQDVLLRFAIYELAYCNFFINNGPCIAATLDKNINYILIKIDQSDSVEATQRKFIENQGFSYKSNPKYASTNQKWIWEDDSFDNILRAFDMFEEEN